MRSWKDRFESRRMVFPGMQARALFAKQSGGKPRTYAAPDSCPRLTGAAIPYNYARATFLSRLLGTPR